MKMLKQARATNLPRFIEERFAKLELLINIVGDTEWELEDKELKTILSALAYFCDPEDLIPDHLPAIGFLDDTIYVEIIAQELSAEISSYEEFFTYRVAEENRRKNRGLDTTVGREDWLRINARCYILECDLDAPAAQAALASVLEFSSRPLV